MPPEDGPGVMGTLADMGKGALHGVQEAFNEAGSGLKSITDRFAGVREAVNTAVFGEERAQAAEALEGEPLWNPDENPIDIVKAPITGFGRGTSGIAQFLTGFALTKKVTGLGGYFGNMANGVVADGLFFDPENPNISKLMQDNGYSVPLLTTALATDPDDPEWVNRVRNSAEGAVAGGLVDLTVRGLYSLAKYAKGARGW